MGANPSKCSSAGAKEKPIIMVLGGPGTGKGTQCGRMVKEFGFRHISLGDILRAEVKNGTQIGKDCEAIMKEGKLVPVKLTMELVQKAMKQAADAPGYLLDGFPRRVSQAKEFQKQVRAPSLVLYLYAPKPLLIHRLMQRGQTNGRADDNMVTINKRLVTFRKESLPVVSYYKGVRSTVVEKICTVTTPDDVYNQVREAVKQVLNSPPRQFRKRFKLHPRRVHHKKVGRHQRRHRKRRKRHHRLVHHRTVGRHHRRHRKRRKRHHHKTVARHHRRHRKRRKRASADECPGHPQGSPMAPTLARQCVLM